MRFRKAQSDDVPMIAGWIDQDAGHKGIDPQFFVADDPFVSCYVIEDGDGPVIFVRQESVAGCYTRLHTQFHPSAKRVAKVLEQAYPLVREDAKQRQFKSVRFESRSIALVRFMIEHFGFRADLIDDL